MAKPKPLQRGRSIESQRVSAVIRIGDRYLLREAFQDSRSLHGYGFPAEQRYFGETPFKTAIRAAANYGFNANPDMLITEDLVISKKHKIKGLHSYFLCHCDLPDFPLQTTCEDLYGNRRILKLMTTDEILSHPAIRGSAKKVISMLDSIGY